MKLLLTSDGFTTPQITNEFLALTGKPVADIRLGVVVPNAIESEIEVYYFNLHMNIFSQIGLVSQNIHIINLDDDLSFESFENLDAIFVCGGNTFYILYKMRESGFDKYIKQFVESGGIYIGESAGSIIAGPDIEIAGWGSEGDENSIGLEDLSGLNFTDISIFPHFKEVLDSEVEEFKAKAGNPVITLTDNQAMSIIGNKAKFIDR